MPVTLASAPSCPPLRRPLAVGIITPGMVLGVLLLICCCKGIWVTIGVEVPPDPDTVRDLGFIQAFQDGNWWGDPAIADSWRWYPPLLHGLAALVIGSLHLPLLPIWLHAGAFLNLLAPLTFYVMNRRLFGPWSAAAATTVFVLFDSVVMPSDAAAGYTPWTLTPALAWPLFFGSVWLIAGRVQQLRMTDAVLVGSALGLVFLAHTVPAVLLSGIVVSTVLAMHGLRRPPLAWLTVIAVVESLWAVPFLLPLAAAYHLKIANPGPGHWVHPALTDPATLVPNLLGLLVLVWLLFQREWSSLPLATKAILGAWIGICVAFLGRHYACTTTAQTSGACGMFVIAAHHYHVYLQAAWASLAGFATVRICAIGRRRDLVPLLILTVSAGLIGFFAKPEDVELRRLGSMQTELILDRLAYDWILDHTMPGDQFVTDLPYQGADMGPGAATVMAAGRQLVAPPEFHSNPYVAWAPLNTRRVAYLQVGANLCPLMRSDSTAYFLLPRHWIVDGTTVVFSSAFNTISRVNQRPCPRGNADAVNVDKTPASTP